MTPNEAFKKIVKANYNSSPFMKCRACLDFGAFYVFCIAPMDVADDGDYFTGTVFDAIDKKTGRIFEYDITDDSDAYDMAKPVSVDTIWTTPVSEVIKD